MRLIEVWGRWIAFLITAMFAAVLVDDVLLFESEKVEEYLSCNWAAALEEEEQMYGCD